jgi:hypothetical protein
MTREDKHALFAAVAMYVLLSADQAKPQSEQNSEAVVVDAAYLADKLIREVEKK